MLAVKGSFLAVLKLYGKANENYLSFPMEGYSLAFDFKIEKGVFEKGYPQIDTFRQFRKDNRMDQIFRSLQSKRVGI